MVSTRSGKATEKVIVEKAIQVAKRKFNSMKECMIAAMNKCQKYKARKSDGKYSKATRDAKRAERESIRASKKAAKEAKKSARAPIKSPGKYKKDTGYWKKNAIALRKSEWESGREAREQRKADKLAKKNEIL